jgi:glycosyltransferase involved in cell wall biosynthesis
MEALPLAWLEGMAMGKAVVASETGPGPEVIEHGVSGLLCDPHDPDSIADALVRALSDEGLRKSLGTSARERAVEHFGIEPVVAKNEAFYRSCIEEMSHAQG